MIHGGQENRKNKYSNTPSMYFLVANMLAGTIKPTECDFAYLLVLSCHSKVEKCCKFGI